MFPTKIHLAQENQDHMIPMVKRVAKVHHHIVKEKDMMWLEKRMDYKLLKKCIYSWVKRIVLNSKKVQVQ